MHNSKILDAYDKNCWFYERVKLSYFTFKNGQETGTEFTALWHQFVYSSLLTPCHNLRKNSEVKKMSSDCESNSFAKLSRISDQHNYGGRWGRCWRISNTQTDVTNWCHVAFWPRDSNSIFEGKIAQLCALVKSTIFIVGNSNF